MFLKLKPTKKIDFYIIFFNIVFYILFPCENNIKSFAVYVFLEQYTMITVDNVCQEKHTCTTFFMFSPFSCLLSKHIQKCVPLLKGNKVLLGWAKTQFTNKQIYYFSKDKKKLFPLL